MIQLSAEIQVLSAEFAESYEVWKRKWWLTTQDSALRTEDLRC